MAQCLGLHFCTKTWIYNMYHVCAWYVHVISNDNIRICIWRIWNHMNVIECAHTPMKSYECADRCQLCKPISTSARKDANTNGLGIWKMWDMRTRWHFFPIFNHLFASWCLDLSMPHCKVQLQLASEPSGTMLDITEHQVWIFLNWSLWRALALHDSSRLAFYFRGSKSKVLVAHADYLRAHSHRLGWQGSAASVSDEQAAADKILDLRKML